MLSFVKAASCGYVLLFATSALAGAGTGPHDPNAIPLRAVAHPSPYCEAGTASATRDGTVFCNGVPNGRFVQRDAVPQGYTGRVIVINEDRGGYQSLGW